MKKITLYVFVFLYVLCVASCSDNDHKPKGQFETGTFVVNEGNFTDADGTISFINPSTSQVTNDLFGSINSGRALGDVVQSMTIDGDQAYIVVNNSNKMEVVNANTFEATYTLQDLKLPRYFTIWNGKGYVTEWVSFSDPGRVSIIDLQNHAVTGHITTDYGAENIIAVNGKLFVSNNFTNTVSVIDPATAQVTKTIEVGDSPGGFAVDGQGKLWVICAGGFDANYNPLNNGRVVQVDPNTLSVAKTIELHTNVSSKLAINKAKTQLYYYRKNLVYRFATTDSNAPASSLITESSATSFYGIGIDPRSDELYLADAKGFAQSGTVYIYTADGALKGTLNVGRGPNGFAFK